MTAAPLLVVAPPWPVFEVTGQDAATWLNGIVTCDVTAVSPALGGWGLLLTKTGKIQGELQLVGQSDRLWLGLSGGVAADVLAILEHYLVMEEAELNAAPTARFLCFYGTDAAIQARELVGHASAMPWASDRGAAVVVQESELPSFIEAARAQGFPVEASPPPHIRLALGLPSYGVDYGEKDNPHEAALERRAVSWSKGCYLGQEVVCMQDMRGRVKRRLARLEGLDVPWETGSAVLAGEATPAGTVTTASTGQAIASLSAPWFEAGQELSVLGRSVRVLPLLGQ